MLNEVLDGLFVSDSHSAHEAATKGLVDCVLDLRSEACEIYETDYYRKLGVEYLNNPCIYEHSVDVCYIDTAVKWVQRRILLKKRVVIHCLAGISSVAVITTAVIMNVHKWSTLDAFEHAVEKRPILRPSQQLWESLSDYGIGKGYEPLPPYELYFCSGNIEG
jgi:protein-tyrosine phosphatase